MPRRYRAYGGNYYNPPEFDGGADPLVAAIAGAMDSYHASRAAQAERDELERQRQREDALDQERREDRKRRIQREDLEQQYQLTSRGLSVKDTPAMATAAVPGLVPGMHIPGTRRLVKTGKSFDEQQDALQAAINARFEAEARRQQEDEERRGLLATAARLKVPNVEQLSIYEMRDAVTDATDREKRRRDVDDAAQRRANIVGTRPATQPTDDTPLFLRPSAVATRSATLVRSGLPTAAAADSAQTEATSMANAAYQSELRSAERAHANNPRQLQAIKTRLRRKYRLPPA